ncbi:sensor domain-containing diguanylate cyclase [Actinophytocola sp.]|uniref:sensor domain-containing diguanylate cyclase n=1 Tax=Actinophytocola sp. TaxID=1872138 RepID=UPI002ED3431A
MSGGKEFYRLLFEHGDAAVLVLDPGDLGIRWASPAAARLFGGSHGPLPDLVAVEDAAVVGTFLEAASADSASRCTCAIPVEGSADRRVDLIVRDLTAVAEVGGLLVVALDVTGSAEQSRKLARLLNSDTKTGLANWTGFRLRLAQAARGAPASGPGPVLVYLDLNHFKMVNDKHGHAVGDEVLRRIASVLSTVIAGRGTAARIGGDEFAVLLDRASEEQARDIAAKMLAVVGAPLTVVEGLVVRVTASAGIAFLRQETKPDVVLRQADLAMYRAKAIGPGRAVVYRDDMADWMLARKQQVDLLAYQVELLRRENEALAQAATIDQRTGLPNPAAFDADHARQHDSGTPYSLLLIDIDHFHSYNTTYRYLAGHQTLREVGQTIARTVRTGDQTYRYGGEEFTVLLPGPISVRP